MQLNIDASAFYPAIEEFYGTGNLPFLRVANVDQFIDYQSAVTIPERLCEKYPTLAQVRKGDILFTKGGSVARIGLVAQHAAVSRDLIFLNSSSLSEPEYLFLFLYFQTSFFNRSLVRSSSQTAQPHLTITLVRELPIFLPSVVFRDAVTARVGEAFQLRRQAINEMAKAERILLQSLGLDTWQPPEPLTYTRRSADVFAAGRLDAEHYQERYYALDRLLKSYPTGTVLLGDICPAPVNGVEIREYYETGVPYLRVGDLKFHNLQLDSVVRVNATEAETLIPKVALRVGDVLVSRSGSLGVTGVVKEEWADALISSHLIRLRIENPEIDPYYLAVFLATYPGRSQIDQKSNGGVQPEINQPSLKSIVVPKLDQEIQRMIRKSVEESHNARNQAKSLLDRAKRAVEIAIEESEAAALAYLDEEEV